MYTHQIDMGRPITNRGWCGKPTCSEERALYEQPFATLRLLNWSRHGLSVTDYMNDFAHAMVDGLFPKLKDGPIKTAKCQSLEWFINSPPVMMAFWYFNEGTRFAGLSTTDVDVRRVASETRLQFLDFLQHPRSKNSISMMHKYAESKNPQPNGEWDLTDYTMRFMLCVEAWRQHGKLRWKDWSVGTSEHVAEFLAALLNNFCIMKQDFCFYLFIDVTEQWWDDNWETWLKQNPTLLTRKYKDESFVPRQHIDGPEEDALDKVGYLGGMGLYRPVWTQRPEVR